MERQCKVWKEEKTKGMDKKVKKLNRKGGALEKTE
jgi:hypothetical protein